MARPNVNSLPAPAHGPLVHPLTVAICLALYGCVPGATRVEEA